jgi:Holliday junction resolvase RusA-like endonuclease
MIHRSLSWKPKAKGRPQYNRKTGNVYTPKDTVLAERALRIQWPDEDKPIEGPIAVTLKMGPNNVRVFIDKLEGDFPHMAGADIDNLGKLVLDALNKVAWVDDGQIKQLTLVIQ